MSHKTGGDSNRFDIIELLSTRLLPLHRGTHAGERERETARARKICHRKWGNGFLSPSFYSAFYYPDCSSSAAANACTRARSNIYMRQRRAGNVLQRAPRGIYSCCRRRRGSGDVSLCRIRGAEIAPRIRDVKLKFHLRERERMQGTFPGTQCSRNGALALLHCSGYWELVARWKSVYARASCSVRYCFLALTLLTLD